MGAGFNGTVYALATGVNNSIFVGGGFTLFNGGAFGRTAGYLVSLYVDATPPTIPIQISPLSGQAFNTGNINLLRSGAIDTGEGVSGYMYQVST